MTTLLDRIRSTGEVDPPPPERRYRLVLDMHADDLEALVHELEDIADLLTAGRVGATSGAPDRGAHFELVDNGPAVTHEVYFEALMAWREARREARPCPT